MNTFIEDPIAVSWASIPIVLVCFDQVLVSGAEGDDTFLVVSQETFLILWLSAERHEFIMVL